MEESIKEKDDELKKRIRLEKITAVFLEEAKKEIKEITIEFNLEREKKIKAAKKLKIEKQSLVELQKKVTLLKIERVKMEHDMEENKESGGDYNQKLVREKEELIKKGVRKID